MNMKKRLAALRQLLADKKAEHERLLNAGGDAAAPFSEDERKVLNALETEIQTIAGDVALLERAVAAATAGPSVDPVIEIGAPSVAQDPKRGFKNIGELAVAVKQAQDIGSGRASGSIDQRLYATATPSNFHTTQGEGVEIPPAFREGIWEIVHSDPLMALLNIEPTDSPVVDIISDETTPWGASGIQARWRAEGAPMTADKLVTKTKQVRVHELYSFALVPEELLEDAPRLADRLNRKAPEAITWKLVEAFVTGTGAGQPLGWMSANNPAKIAVTRSGANLIAAADVLGMYARLLVGDGNDQSFWVGNRAIVPQLLTMTIGQQPVWLPPTGLAGQPSGGFLLGRPLFWSDHAETLGTAGDLQLINPAGYYAVTRGAARQDSSIHLFFDYAITAFRQMVRFGGQPFMNAVLTPAKGSTRAFFVHLT